MFGYSVVVQQKYNTFHKPASQNEFCLMQDTLAVVLVPLGSPGLGEFGH